MNCSISRSKPCSLAEDGGMELDSSLTVDKNPDVEGRPQASSAGRNSRTSGKHSNRSSSNSSASSRSSGSRSSSSDSTRSRSQSANRNSNKEDKENAANKSFTNSDMEDGTAGVKSEAAKTAHTRAFRPDKVSRWDTNRSSTNGTSNQLTDQTNKPTALANKTPPSRPDKDVSSIKEKTPQKLKAHETKAAKRGENLDMFSENDMFGDNFVVDKSSIVLSGRVDNPNLLDNWDDAEGYYRVRIGEVLDHR